MIQGTVIAEHWVTDDEMDYALRSVLLDSGVTMTWWIRPPDVNGIHLEPQRMVAIIDALAACRSAMDAAATKHGIVTTKHYLTGSRQQERES